MRYYIFALLFLLLSCEEETHVPQISGDTPAKVNKYVVTNYHGSAEIEYEVPDAVTSYVLAEYTPIVGKPRQVKASKFNSKLKLEGFEAAGKYEVLLYSVNDSELKSDPIKITVEPLEPPYKLAFNTLSAGATFGGFTAMYQNSELADLTLEVLVKNEKNEWQVVERNNSAVEDVKFTARGYTATPREFGFYFRDRWSNFSDTLYKTITPYEEKLIDMSRFYETNFPTDTYQGHLTGVTGGRKISFLFDGKFTQQTSWYTQANSGIPQHFTIYLQDTYQLSRLKLWQRGGDDYYYQAANVKSFEVYGSVDPNPDGSFASWTLLGKFENIKPSGQPVGTNTDVDNATAAAGEDYEFEMGIPPVKYIRIKVTDTWGKQTFMYISEMEIYGAKVN